MPVQQKIKKRGTKTGFPFLPPGTYILCYILSSHHDRTHTCSCHAFVFDGVFVKPLVDRRRRRGLTTMMAIRPPTSPTTVMGGFSLAIMTGERERQRER